MGPHPRQRIENPAEYNPLPNHIPKPSDKNASKSGVFMSPSCPYGMIVTFFHSVEKFPKVFPQRGKIAESFSIVWKNRRSGLELRFPAAGERAAGARKRREMFADLWKTRRLNREVRPI